MIFSSINLMQFVGCQLPIRSGASYPEDWASGRPRGQFSWFRNANRNVFVWLYNNNIHKTVFIYDLTKVVKVIFTEKSILMQIGDYCWRKTVNPPSRNILRSVDLFFFYKWNWILGIFSLFCTHFIDVKVCKV